VLDDLVEIATIIFASIVVGRAQGYVSYDIWFNLSIFAVLFLAVFLLMKFRQKVCRKIEIFNFSDVGSLFLFVMFFIFLFIGVGQYVESAALGAILAGIALKNIFPKKNLKIMDAEIRTMTYGFFAPIFFFWVGIDTDVTYLIAFPLLVIMVMLMTNATKIISSYIMGKKTLGTHKSIILGICLSVKFSTSIVIIKLLFENNLIPSHLYSVLVGATIGFKFVVPFLLAYLTKVWKIRSPQIS